MRKLILASVSLLLLTNVAVLAGVAYNRSGDPLLSLELTERELRLSQSFNSNEENSGTSLSLKWQILDPDEDSNYQITYYGTPIWLNDEKLTELGFDMKELKSSTDKYRYRTSHFARQVILVLEYDGKSYQKALALAERKRDRIRQMVEDAFDDDKLVKRQSSYDEQLQNLKVSETRLYVVDAGLDEQVLLQKYAATNNHLLVRGEIGLRWSDDEVKGRIRQLRIKQIHAPLPLSEQLTTLAAGEIYSTHSDEPVPPRYKVRLSIGQRFEPWIESVEAINVKKGR